MERGLNAGSDYRRTVKAWGGRRVPTIPAGTNGQSGQTGTVQISNGDLVTATFRKEEEVEIDHPGASRHHGQIWVSLNDMEPGVYAGDRVSLGISILIIILVSRLHLTTW